LGSSCSRLHSSAWPGEWSGSATAYRSAGMDYLLGGVVSVALCVYLLYALLKPERF